VIDRIINAVAAVALVGAALFAGYGLYVGTSERDSLRAERDALRTDIATQRARFEAEARRQEREQHLALAGIRSIFDKEMEDANAEHNRVVDGLRADALRLRQHWQGCTATAELSATAAAAARAYEDAELRARGAADLVRLGAECDARIHGLQSAVRVYSGGTP
jgi:hypothetical protein